MKYKLYYDVILGESVGVFAIDDTGKASAVPFAEGNTDYQAYLEWLEEGNEPLPPDEPTSE